MAPRKTSNSDEPLATYVERLPQVRRILRLYDDRVEIDAAWTFGGEYHQVVQLTDLGTQATRFRVRDRWFRRAITIGMLALAAAVIFTRPGYSLWVARFASVGYGIAAVCAFLAALTFTKRQFVRFLRLDGRPGLDICRAGPDRGHFEEFTTQIHRRIRRAKK